MYPLLTIFFLLHLSLPLSRFRSAQWLPKTPHDTRHRLQLFRLPLQRPLQKSRLRQHHHQPLHQSPCPPAKSSRCLDTRAHRGPQLLRKGLLWPLWWLIFFFLQAQAQTLCPPRLQGPVLDLRRSNERALWVPGPATRILDDARTRSVLQHGPGPDAGGGCVPGRPGPDAGPCGRAGPDSE